jgi:thioredoxin 1
MKEISALELREKINNKESMVVDFYATWCVPCKMLSEELTKVESEYPIYKVDVEEDIDLSTLMGIRSVPAIKYIKEGEVVSTTIGLKSAKEINNLITENMA